MAGFKSNYAVKQIENGYILVYPRAFQVKGQLQVEMAERYYQSFPALTDFIKIHETGEKGIHYQVPGVEGH